MRVRLLALLAALLGPFGCTNVIAARARATPTFPRTWDEPALMPQQQLAQVSLAAATPAPVAQPARQAISLKGLVAVLDFRNKVKGAEGEQLDPAYFANAVRGQIKRQAPNVQVMTRENVLVLLGAQGKKLEDCEGECEVDTGRRLGADHVVSGDLLKVGSKLKLDLRLHETKNGQLLSGTTLSAASVDELDEKTARAVTDLLEGAR